MFGVAVVLLLCVRVAAAIGPPKYDRNTEVTIIGVIEEVQFKSMPFRGRGIFIELGTEKGPTKVIVGPAKYLEKHNFSLNPGDQLEIVGSKVRFRGADAVLARSMKKGSTVLMLRNEAGDPQW